MKLRMGTLAVLVLVAIGIYAPGTDLGNVAGTVDVLNTGACEESKLCVIFFDVGQGDAIYIESPDGTQVLIDGGRGSGVLRELSDELGFFDKDLDIVIATHPDTDHMGGLIDVLERYDVSGVVRTENVSNTSVAEAFDRLVDIEDAEMVYARRGQTIDIGGGASLEILFPDLNPKDLESNASSIVARLVYGETEFMFMGDLPKNIEEYLVLIEGENLESDVLKVGHHGSRTSTSELFLAEVNPEYAVISAGKDNRYGHPHVEVTDLLFNYGVETFNTAEVGSVVMISDGKTIEISR